jgi:hypothetical protein
VRGGTWIIPHVTEDKVRVAVAGVKADDVPESLRKRLGGYYLEPSGKPSFYVLEYSDMEAVQEILAMQA